MNRFYCIDASAVVSDVVDGEAVMLHRVSGDYFSTDGVGCAIWQSLGAAQSRQQILDWMDARFTADPHEMAVAVNSFLADLVAHQLVREIDGGAAPAAEIVAAAPGDRTPGFTPPVLNVYSDVRTLLLLDPIHDVETSAGWPMPKAADGAG